jgi:hypothetical protein
MDLGLIGRILIVMGLGLAVLGFLFLMTGKLPFPGWGWLGRLPGDIYIERKNFVFYFPLATGLLLSAVLSAIFWLLTRR